eukprot:c47151_g1_i1.p1 GENE.c47151_g1_i1~~c47151_g1_i1.p1  ORF type:complete len:320 (-),score=40.56 c47151_g1_i1:8-967(-)
MTDAAAPTNSIFVGNIPTQATAEDLSNFFNRDGKVKITNAKVVKTKDNARVFAFVEVATQAEVQKVIENYHDKEMNGNKLVLQVAQPPRKRAPKPAKPQASSSSPPHADGSAAPASGDGATKRKRVRKPRGPRAPAAGGDGATAAAVGAAVSNTAVATAGADGANAKRQRNRKPAGENNNNNSNNNGSNNNGGDAAAAKPRRPRRERKPDDNNNSNNNHEKIDPTTTLFVANLPFDVDEEALKIFMSVPPGKVTISRIVRVRHNNRSKGFGFVTFDSTAARDASLAAKNNQKIGERVISVNIAKEEKPEKTKKETNTQQ